MRLGLLHAVKIGRYKIERPGRNVEGKCSYTEVTQIQLQNPSDGALSAASPIFMGSHASEALLARTAVLRCRAGLSGFS